MSFLELVMSSVSPRQFVGEAPPHFLEGCKVLKYGTVWPKPLSLFRSPRANVAYIRRPTSVHELNPFSKKRMQNVVHLGTVAPA